MTESQGNTISLSVGIKYSTRDQICDVKYCAWAAEL